MAPTPEQLANLEKLATYLESDNLKAEFDMDVYCEDGHFHGSDNCGSIGCAIGHGPYAGIKKSETEAFLVYSRRVFGLDHNLFGDWVHCFGYHWAKLDNTPRGAAARIRQVIAKYVPSQPLPGEPKDDGRAGSEDDGVLKE